MYSWNVYWKSNDVCRRITQSLFAYNIILSFRILNILYWLWCMCMNINEKNLIEGRTMERALILNFNRIAVNQHLTVEWFIVYQSKFECPFLKQFFSLRTEEITYYFPNNRVEIWPGQRPISICDLLFHTIKVVWSENDLRLFFQQNCYSSRSLGRKNTWKQRMSNFAKADFLVTK